MTNFLFKHRYLIARRFTQISLMLLYLAGNFWGWSILQGNLSASMVFGLIPLSDPYALLQMFAAGALIATNVLVGAIIITLFYFIVGGRAFCSWVCPVNIVTDLAAWVRQTFGFNQIQKRQPASRNMRYWVLALSLIISVALGITAFE
ncbi:MAG: 4Fe-4S binding protein, partial [Campylobacterota bacterium]|nr:4Fe-4S binding protein [Campylobacterota bacterium]